MKIESLSKLAKHKVFKTALFVIVLLATSYYYNYREIITYRPTSIHQWRNSVSASIALNYYHEGEFFHPRTNNMQVDDYTSDVTITEFPIVYYFIGMMYRLFGFHEIIYKLINVLIGFTGLYFLFLMGLRAFKNTFYALILPLFIFSSPIYVYYINNFIPDAPSLSIVFIGLYFFYRFYEDGINRNLILCFLFLCFAGLLKTPALLLYFAIAGLFLLERILKMKLKAEGLIFEKWPQNLLYFLGAFILIVAWYAYAKIYTDMHGGVVSLVEIRPIWRLSPDYIKDIWAAVTKRFWAGVYHSPVLLIISFILLIHNAIFWKKYDRMLSLLVALTFLGGICFSLLFFRSMKQHDYYQMNNLIVPLLIIFNFLIYLKNNKIKIFNSLITKMIFGAFLVFLIFSGNRLLNGHYYKSWFHDYTIENYNKNFDKITPYLRSLGIERTDKVYCSPDPSINISLYLMDQKGFTDFMRKDYTFQENLEFFFEKGCKYLILSKSDVLLLPVNKIVLNKIGEYEQVEIYRLDNP